MAYEVEGKLLEVCTCNILCPCWVGEDPDGGTCDGLLVWMVEKGLIDGVDVSGHALAILGHIPGNILKGNWNVRIYLDDKATSAQKDAMLNVWSGKLGGPIADMAALIGTIDSVEQVPISYSINGADGEIHIGSSISASLQAYRGATGQPTAMYDTIFTTIPGSAAYVGKANSYKAQAPGFNIDLKDHNAVSGSFRFTG